MIPYVRDVIGIPYANDAEILKNFDLGIVFSLLILFLENNLLENLLKSSISRKGNATTLDIKFPITILKIKVLIKYPRLISKILNTKFKKVIDDIDQ
tara:strand:- start:942 stop:1232 length:291 start_codon:yes stop_codon:yes gene_type:complete